MKCCICGKVISGYGNNPYPISKREDDKCCDECNIKVILARLKMMRDNNKKRGDK